MPGFAVSVGVLSDGIPLAGAVYDPVSDWLFTAAVGRGAWLNGRALMVATTPLSTAALFSIRTPYDGDLPLFVERWLGRYRLRRLGSAALHLCYVATGSLAFVHDHDAPLWALAGAVPVLQEAGGVITGLDGSPLFPIDPKISGQSMAFIAGNPLSHRRSLDDILAVEGHPVTR